MLKSYIILVLQPALPSLAGSGSGMVRARTSRRIQAVYKNRVLSIPGPSSFSILSQQSLARVA
jgi:hypothetical protein